MHVCIHKKEGRLVNKNEEYRDDIKSIEDKVRIIMMHISEQICATTPITQALYCHHVEPLFICTFHITHANHRWDQGTKLGVILRWPHWPLTDSCRSPIQILSCHIIVCIHTLIYIEAPHACVNSMLLFYTLHLNTVKLYKT